MTVTMTVTMAVTKDVVLMFGLGVGRAGWLATKGVFWAAVQRPTRQEQGQSGGCVQRGETARAGCNGHVL
jgi:hypothetical protein